MTPIEKLLAAIDEEPRPGRSQPWIDKVRAKAQAVRVDIALQLRTPQTDRDASGVVVGAAMNRISQLERAQLASPMLLFEFTDRQITTRIKWLVGPRISGVETVCDVVSFASNKALTLDKLSERLVLQITK